MAAERRRAAGRDRADHAPLDAAEMSGVSRAIGLAVAAENIRQFHARRAVAGPADAAPVYPGGMTSSDSRSRGLSVARITCGGDARVARRRRQIVVAEQDLDDPDVDSALQEMRREAVAQRVHVTRLVRSGRDAPNGMRRAGPSDRSA